MAKILQEKEDKGLISRTSGDNHVLGDFLHFLANDIKNNPSHVQSFNPTLIDQAHHLTSGVKVDFDVSLDDKDSS